MYRLARCAAWFLTRVCYRLKRSGEENIPQSGAAILVCNHIHMMDAACMLIQSKRPIRFMAKKELFENKLLGWALGKIGAFPISRGEADVSGIRTAMKILKDGELLCIFPEGTRNRERREPLLPLQDGVAMLALRCKVDIVPSWIEGGYSPWRPNRMVTGSKLDLSTYEGIRKPGQEEMQRLTAEIREAMLGCRDELLKQNQ